MMLMQTPGGFLLAFSLYLQPGTNWTSWLPFFMAGTLQGTLLVMCICLTCISPQPHIEESVTIIVSNNDENEDEDEDDANESTSLLPPLTQ
jgi:hypothetical protein